MDSRRISRLNYRFGISFFLIAGIIGVIIRWHFLNPIKGFPYKNWLHAHSHITFLGWVFLGIIAVLCYHFKDIPSFPRKTIRNLTWLIVIANVGMLISFPIEGYGPVSIFFSAVHMVLGIYTYILFSRIFKGIKSFGISMIKSSFLFMILSGLGPIALGPIITLGYKTTYWYEFAVYFYLHFQYNGWFTLAIVGIMIHYLNPRGMNSKWIWIINLSVLLTYFLSTLGVRPALWIYIIGGIGGLMQIIGFAYVTWHILKNYQKFFESSRFSTNILLGIALIAFEIKLLLQFFSSIPSIADWIMHSRNLVIAYLHFVLLGFVTSFILGWWNKIYVSKDSREFRLGTILFFIGLTGTEITLFLYGIKVFPSFVLPYQLLLVFSIILTLSILLYFVNSFQQSKEREYLIKHDE